MTLDRPLSVGIVDDEALARRGIRSRLSRHGDVTVAAECKSGREAVAALRDGDLDLVFLDIQMPGLDGFDVIEAIGPEEMPVVIFVTAYDEHALRAFDVHALDYLLKPLDEERFQEALGRARSRIAEREAGELETRLTRLLSSLDEETAAEPDRAASGEEPVARFVVKSGGRVRFVKTDAIEWVEAAGDYVTLHTADRAHLLRTTMKEMEAALPTDRFVRIHRSTIIRVDAVQELRPYGANNEYIVMLRDGSERKLSRTYRSAVEAVVTGEL